MRGVSGLSNNLATTPATSFAGDAPLTACHTAAQVHIVTRPVLILTR